MKKLHFLLVFLLLLKHPFVTAQTNLSQIQWHFGIEGAHINFITGNAVPVNPSSSSLLSAEACATMCDRTTGELLFYTNSIDIWDKNDVLITTGSKLNGSVNAGVPGHSGPQSCLIVPMPGNLNRYYIFTVSDAHGYLPYQNNGLCYTIVEVNATSVSIIGSLNVPVDYTGSSLYTTTQLTAIANCDSTYWIITHGLNEATGANDQLRAHLLSSTGVAAPIVSTGFSVNWGVTSTGIPDPMDNGWIAKASPDGNKVAFVVSLYTSATSTYSSINTYVYDFDKLSGSFSNEQVFLGGEAGMEFSPNSQLLYTITVVGQYQIWQHQLSNSISLLTDITNYGRPTLAPDHRIYFITQSGDLDVVNNPDAIYSFPASTSLGYVPMGVVLPDKAMYCLPNFMNALEPGGYTDNDFSYSILNCGEVLFSNLSTCSSLNWDFGDPASGSANSSTLAYPSHIYPGPGTYTVTLVIGGSSSTTLSHTIEILLPPQPAIYGPLLACNNESINYYIDNFDPLYHYAWTISGGQPPNAINVTQVNISWQATTGSVQLIATDPVNGCVSDTEIYITVLPAPVVTAAADPVYIYAGESSNLLANGADAYSWQPVIYLDDPAIANPVSNPPSTITYIVVGSDTANNCKSTDTVTVFVLEDTLVVGHPCELYIPSAFSPNGDKNNDVFYVRGDCIRNLHLILYDRLGEKVFETNDPAIGWDGTYKGKVLDAAVFAYWCKVTLAGEAPFTKKGNVSLVR